MSTPTLREAVAEALDPERRVGVDLVVAAVRDWLLTRETCEAAEGGVDGALDTWYADPDDPRSVHLVCASGALRAVADLAIAEKVA